MNIDPGDEIIGFDVDDEVESNKDVSSYNSKKISICWRRTLTFIIISSIIIIASFIFIYFGEQEPYLDPLKREFLEEFSADYGYKDNIGLSIESMRGKQLPQLDNNYYLDYTGASLATRQQIFESSDLLINNLWGNPHSVNPSSSYSNLQFARTTAMLLDFLGTSADTHSVIYTSGATEAIKIVGENFDSNSDSVFVYSTVNHASVVGLTQFFDPNQLIPVSSLSITVLRETIFNLINERAFPLKNVLNLIAIPLQSNLDGSIVSLVELNDLYTDLLMKDKDNRWLFLVDGAAYVPTHKMNLQEQLQIDFFPISFYKIFGYPTGLGALVVKREVANVLKKKYFGGGTILYTTTESLLSEENIYRHKSFTTRFQDGTVAFSLIPQLQFGFKMINSLSMSKVNKHTMSLTNFLVKKLNLLKYKNYAINPIIFAGKHSNVAKDKIISVDAAEQGPIIAIMLKKVNGQYISSRAFVDSASFQKIHLREGCQCNYGHCDIINGIDETFREDYFHNQCCHGDEKENSCFPVDTFSNWTKRFEQALDDGSCGCGASSVDPIKCPDVFKSRPLGVIRISFGYSSSFEDIKAFYNFLIEYLTKEGGDTIIEVSDKV
eukprot:TRINITY_DN3320_c2_g3_i2.p1 TRINITY_DN3320_c2_g3~~TRINITY_DN3320_c2_g3_i2.p1  ORF type:complete len:615 (+),score=134.25 TRINITY_DN3320_c2_g3_i2:27-1847(+)